MAEQTKVTKQTISWSKRAGFHPKQQSEDQNDTMGYLMKSVTLFKMTDGKRVTTGEMVIQRDGKPVEKTVSTFQRQLIKLMGACWFAGVSSIKGAGYLETVAKNAAAIKELVGGLAKAGYQLDYCYGTRKEHLVADPVTLMGWCIQAVSMLKATDAQYPPEDEPTKKADDTVVEEEVAVTF